MRCGRWHFCCWLFCGCCCRCCRGYRDCGVRCIGVVVGGVDTVGGNVVDVGALVGYVVCYICGGVGGVAGIDVVAIVGFGYVVVGYVVVMC